MKKIVALILLITFFYPSKVLSEEVTEEPIKGSEVYLLDLKVTDYVMSPQFDKYNNLYTLIINEAVTNLNVEYKVESEKSLVEISGNESLRTGENHIYINVQDENGLNENVYELIVTIEDKSLMPAFGEFLIDIEKSQEINESEVSFIVIGCFVLVMIAFRIIFIRVNK